MGKIGPAEQPLGSETPPGREIAERECAEQALHEGNERLHRANSDLVQRVAKLQVANAEVQEARRAALNLMEDAVQSRQALETLNGQLRESEERYRILFAVAPMAVFVCDQNAVIQQYNERAVELWGREPVCGVEQHCGSVKLWLPDGTRLPHAESPVVEVLRSGVPVLNVEVFIERPDGSRLPVLVNFAPLRNAAREVTGAITSFTDISDRKRAEVALQESERRFREMINALPAAIYTTDAGGRITHFNPAAVEFSGRTPELGTDRWCVSWKLYHPDGTPMPHDECPMAITLKEGRVVSGAEAIIERPDGTRRWFTPYPTLLRDAEGRVVGGINMLVDITERKQAEETRARMAAIVESSDDAIISKTLEGNITSWNQGAERLFGYTAQEAIGQPITLLIPPDRLQEEPEILARIKRGEHIEHFETVRVRKDGSPLEISLTISPIRDGKGRVIGASKIARDITESKQAQERERLLTNELAHRGKNLLALVQAIVSRSLSGKASVDEVRDTLTQRIQALSRSQSLLLNGGFEGARLAEIIGLEFEAFSERVEVSGPNLVLNPRSTQTFALLVHELATNATKHGALSRPQGRVAIDWSIEGAGAEAKFKFQWQERGGPPVAPPTRKGFGRILIERAVAQDFGAQPKIEFAPEGLRYRIDAPLSAVGGDDNS